MSETVYDPTLVGGGKPNPGEELVIVVARPNLAYYVNIHVANTNSGTEDYSKVAVVPAGETLGPKHWISFDTVVTPNNLYILPNIGLGPQDQVIVSSTNGFLTFNVTGNKFYDI